MIKFHEEQLLVLMTTDDDAGLRLGAAPGTPYFRAFVLKNRATGKVWATFRFAYASGERNWYEIRPQQQDEATEHRLRCSLEDVINTASKMMNFDAKPDFHYPPVGCVSAEDQLHWALTSDLMKVVGVEGPNGPV